MQASNVTELLFSRLEFLSEKQKVITSNIANINTPNYKTKTLEFDTVLNDVVKAANKGLALSTTHHRHIGLEKNVEHQVNNRLKEVPHLQEQNDGNNVSLDKELGKMSKNRTEFHAIQSAIKKDSRWFKSVIESSAKN